MRCNLWNQCNSHVSFVNCVENKMRKLYRMLFGCCNCIICYSSWCAVTSLVDNWRFCGEYVQKQKYAMHKVAWRGNEITLKRKAREWMDRKDRKRWRRKINSHMIEKQRPFRKASISNLCQVLLENWVCIKSLWCLMYWQSNSNICGRFFHASFVRQLCDGQWQTSN